ncbi:F-box family protein [Heracleum sosnowskyi]|uniref:F-box family protein n=1 Tax=Heracleum sosnowskyi TaxID=360622 RepID=A0AAD8MVU7_9APIA|nr:F-box family protein [Heracleum sosnowskyi]
MSITRSPWLLSSPLPFLVASFSSSRITFTCCPPLRDLLSSLPSQYPGRQSHITASYRYSSYSEDEEDDALSCSFDEAVVLFNERDYYKCHDVLESLWNRSQDPTRTLVHGILQCAVGFHHLFNQNHKGAMMELGEGVCKLRKMNFKTGPFFEFEKEISAVLEFIYQTQLEFAACIEDYCLAMDQSEKSYKLLGGYGARQRMYSLDLETDYRVAYIVFCPEGVESYSAVAFADRPRIKLPNLHATQQQLIDLDYN